MKAKILVVAALVLLCGAMAWADDGKWIDNVQCRVHDECDYYAGINVVSDAYRLSHSNHERVAPGAAALGYITDSWDDDDYIKFTTTADVPTLHPHPREPYFQIWDGDELVFDLQQEIKDLKERVDALEKAMKPFDFDTLTPGELEKLLQCDTLEEQVDALEKELLEIKRAENKMRYGPGEVHGDVWLH